MPTAIIGLALGRGGLVQGGLVLGLVQGGLALYVGKLGLERLAEGHGRRTEGLLWYRTVGLLWYRTVALGGHIIDVGARRSHHTNPKWLRVH